MEQDILSKLSSVIILATVMIWLGVLVHQLSVKKSISKILNAQSPEDVVSFRCETVKKRMDRMRKFKKFFIIVLVVLSLNYLIGTVLRTVQLLSDSAITNLTLNQIMRIIRPISILIIMSGLGAYKLTKDALDYFTILVRKCKELENIETR